MEKAVVKFINPETNEEIKLDFSYNKEENNIDYELSFSEGYDKNKPMDFIGFLADMFLKSLQN